jgi:hypothetical protein
MVIAVTGGDRAGSGELIALGVASRCNGFGRDAGRRFPWPRSESIAQAVPVAADPVQGAARVDDPYADEPYALSHGNHHRWHGLAHLCVPSIDGTVGGGGRLVAVES